MNYTCFRANGQRISPSSPTIKINASLREENLSAIPLVIDGRIILAYRNKSLCIKDLETNVILWKVVLNVIIEETLIIGNVIFASNYSSLFVIDLTTGKIIKQLDNAVPNLTNAIVFENLLIWPTYMNDKNILRFFDIKKIEFNHDLQLNGLASFFLRQQNNLIVNQYPNIFNAIDIISGKINWETELVEKSDTDSFINDYPFIIEDKLYITQFPDLLTCISVSTGKKEWEIKTQTGINSFCSNYYNGKEIAYFSGSLLFIINYVTGKISRTVNLENIQSLKSGLYTVCFFNDTTAFFYSYTANKAVEIDINTISELKVFKLVNGLKTPPFIAHNILFLVDKTGNLYY